jgi:transcriptional repressor NrdR
MPSIIKKDGRREEFTRDKIRSGIQKAVSKRPITREQIEAIVSGVERQLLTLGVREVAARTIGEWVMRELRAIDSVAYIRFASVYREFKDVREFVDELTAEHHAH